MAPKKKKKATSNPARGFSTVSVPSKSKEDPIKHEADDSSDPSVDTAEASKPPALPDNVENPDKSADSKAIKDMTADELERHLEDAQFMNIVNSFGPSMRREAVRQISRLEIERRTLRAQSLASNTTSWLPDNLVDEVLALYQAQVSMCEHKSTSQQGLDDVQSQHTLIKLWTLNQILTDLHVPRKDEILEYVVSLLPDRVSPGKDYSWGLEEAFEWLALHGSRSEILSYHSNAIHGVRPGRESKFASSTESSRAASPNALSQLRTENDHRSSSRPAPPWVEVTGDEEPHGSDQEKSLASDDIVESSDDDDNDPSTLVKKHVEAKTKLFMIENSSDNASSAPRLTSFPSLNVMQTARIHRTIAQIERDILFDAAEAAAQWHQKIVTLQLELARTRAEKALSAPQAQQDDQTLDFTEEVDGGVDSEEHSMFGDMFVSAQQYSAGKPDDAPGSSEQILLLDFGKWTGQSPRKTLEETCKARDSACKIKIQSISSSTYSNRHSLQIAWSKPQHEEIRLAALPSRMSLNFQPLLVNATMDTIATPTKPQSEAYISTVVLFALFANSSKDSKVYMRLPVVWRDLWKDMLTAQERMVVEEDQHTLRMLSKRVSDRVSRLMVDSNDATLPMRKPQIVDGTKRSAPVAQSTSETKAALLQSLWKEKTSTPSYNAMLRNRQRLPIFGYKEEILSTFFNQQVTILCAETGAGKSTQIPSYILERELIDGRDCRILVTQPRRISATSLARRVSAELGERRDDMGTPRSVVGYSIRLESKTTSSSRITYATTGVLLRMLETTPDLNDLTHLIFDEVHERTLDLDLLFIVVRRLLTRRPELTVVLMSATVDAQRFSDYFGQAPILQLPGRTFPVAVKYLEDAIEETQFSSNRNHNLHDQQSEETPTVEEDRKRSGLTLDGLEHYSVNTRASIASYDEYHINYDLVVNLAALIASRANYAKYSNAILIFMPGIAEIRQLHKHFASHPSFIHGWSFNLLHSSFSSEEMDQAFQPPPHGMRKIIIATNIAETGITIPDITAVIDTCTEKTMRFDERRQISRLTENFVSKSACRQRRGRAARVQDGLCFHLVTKKRFETLMPEQHTPEILRLSLQDAVLRVKIWDIGDIAETLGQAIDPPSNKNTQRAIDALKEIGALTRDEELTPLGRNAARLPVDVSLGKLVILGIVFGCLDAAITIAAMISTKSLFLTSSRETVAAEKVKLKFSRGDSDLLLNYNAYLAWIRAQVSGNAVEFCRKSFLDHKALIEVEEQKLQLLTTVVDDRILAFSEDEKAALRRARGNGRNHERFTVPDRYNFNNSNDDVLSSLIATSFYPKLLRREGLGWRNVSTNQHVRIVTTSVNRAAGSPLRWLSFHQAMQTKGHLNVSITSSVPEKAIILLLGDGEVKIFAGVVAIDGSRLRFHVHDWKTSVAIKILRTKIQEIVVQLIRNPSKKLSHNLEKWNAVWQRLNTQ